MPADYARLKSILANSKIQRDNNALYQAILGLIQATQELQVSSDSGLLTLNQFVESLTVVNVINVDTSTAPQSFILADYITVKRGLNIFKDISGNAFVNNITLTGTVDGVVDPVINTNYGLMRIYLGSDILMHEW